VYPEPTVVASAFANPVGARPVLDDDDDALAVVEIPRGDAAALSRAPADGFDNQGVFSRVWRPWDAYENGELGDRVRDTHDRLRKSHHIRLTSLNVLRFSSRRPLSFG